MAHKTEDLDALYGAASPAEARRLYDDWAKTYDAENFAKGFWLPIVGAGLFAKHAGQVDGRVLDAGCGTGLAGVTLRQLGYGPLTGCDLSPEMMAVAAQTGCYADFAEADMGAGLPFDDGHFAGFTCFGSFGPGHAPPHSLEHLARVTRKGGVGVFNVVEATYEEQGFPALIDRLCADGVWQVEESTAPLRAYLLAEADLLVRCYAVRMR